jgi:hypothetical protein
MLHLAHSRCNPLVFVVHMLSIHWHDFAHFEQWVQCTSLLAKQAWHSVQSEHNLLSPDFELSSLAEQGDAAFVSVMPSSSNSWRHWHALASSVVADAAASVAFGCSGPGRVSDDLHCIMLPNVALGRGESGVVLGRGGLAPCTGLSPLVAEFTFAALLAWYRAHHVFERGTVPTVP